MRIWLNHFSAPKIGNTDEELEDAFGPKDECIICKDSILVALADGATDGTFSKQWAECLVTSFCNSYSGSFTSLLEGAKTNWVNWKHSYLSSRNENSKPMPWYEELGIERGGFSTFLGLQFMQSDERSGIWKAIAIGDTCLFQIRGDNLKILFPIKHSEQFNNRPMLIASNPLFNGRINEEKSEVEGDWLIDDQFYLMSDALSCWFLQMHESGNNPWRIIRDLYKDDSEPYYDGEFFTTWIDEQRSLKNIRNDDITLLRIDMI